MSNSECEGQDHTESYLVLSSYDNVNRGTSPMTGKVFQEALAKSGDERSPHKMNWTC